MSASCSFLCRVHLGGGSPAAVWCTTFRGELALWRGSSRHKLVSGGPVGIRTIWLISMTAMSVDSSSQAGSGSAQIVPLRHQALPGLSPAAILLQPCRPPHSVFNRRYQLDTLTERLAYACARTAPIRTGRHRRMNNTGNQVSFWGLYFEPSISKKISNTLVLVLYVVTTNGSVKRTFDDVKRSRACHAGADNSTFKSQYNIFSDRIN